jgi:hypothetical protein
VDVCDFGILFDVCGFLFCLKLWPQALKVQLWNWDKTHRDFAPQLMWAQDLTQVIIGL